MIKEGEREMLDKLIRGHVKAFTNAIDLGAFTKKPEDRDYVGPYTYMFSDGRYDWFKDRYSREYTPIAYQLD